MAAKRELDVGYLEQQIERELDPNFAPVLAIRAALRMFPLVLGYAADSKSSDENSERVVISAFRALFISWAAKKYRQDQLKNAAGLAARHVSEVSDSLRDHSIFSVLYCVALATSSVSSPRAKTIAEAINLSCELIEELKEECIEAYSADMRLATSGSDDVLIDQPLWIMDVRGDRKYRANFPVILRSEFDKFVKVHRSSENNWTIISKWYRSILPNNMDSEPKGLFGLAGDVSIAGQPSAFWESDPNQVVAQIANLAFDNLPTDLGEASKSSGDSTDLNRFDPVSPHSDEPTAVDQLERWPFAQVLVERMDEVRKTEGRDGFAVHLHGPWGSGKTSILCMMEEIMTSFKRTSSDRWSVVYFNAWKNERRNPPWWPLIQEVRRACQRSLWHNNRGLNQTQVACRVIRECRLRIYWMFWRMIADFLPYAISGTVLVYLFYHVLLNNDGSFVFTESGIVDIAIQKGEGIAKLVAVCAAVYGLFIAVGRAVVFGSVNTANFYSDISRDPLERISRLFHKIVKINRSPVCIFIDDLDRCSPDYVVDLLEGIQTSFRDQNVAYVIAADKAWIRASFEARYEKFVGQVGDSAQPLGYLFLEKIFQISTPIPGMGGRIKSSYWNGLLGEATRSENDNDREKLNVVIENRRMEIQNNYKNGITVEEAKKLIEVDRSIENRAAVTLELNISPMAKIEAEHNLSRLSRLLSDNPRVMKRMLNNYSMYQSRGILENFDVSSVSLARWTIIEQRYPALADILTGRPAWVGYLNGYPANKVPEDIPHQVAPFVDLDGLSLVVGDQDGSKLTERDIRLVTQGASS